MMASVFFFVNAMKNCNVKINDNIFFEGGLFPLNEFLMSISDRPGAPVDANT